MISVDLLDDILLSPTTNAWDSIISTLYNIFSPSFNQSPVQEIIRREKKVNTLETLISGSCWDLWKSFEQAVPKTSQLIIDFWNKNFNGKAVFIIDGLSLREIPFILDGARKRGFSIQQSKISASALPSDTTYFAKSLGFSQRSSLENNSAGNTHLLKGAKTDCVDLPWRDCLKLIGPEPNWVLWHTWFDDKIHELKVPGKGLRELSVKSQENFTSDDFWALVDKLSYGRRLVITSDHGYAATGEFLNVGEDQGDYLKATYKNQRYTKSENRENTWVPPIDIEVDSPNGLFRYVLGLRKWRNSGGYPTLAHGGLSLMETLVPFIELSK